MLHAPVLSVQCAAEIKLVLKTSLYCTPQSKIPSNNFQHLNCESESLSSGCSCSICKTVNEYSFFVRLSLFCFGCNTCMSWAGNSNCGTYNTCLKYFCAIYCSSSSSRNGSVPQKVLEKMFPVLKR